MNKKNNSTKSRRVSQSKEPLSCNKKIIAQDYVSDKTHQIKALFSDYYAHHPLCKKKS